MALPLTNLLRTKYLNKKPRLGCPILRTTDCQWAFEQLKSLFAKEPVLKHPDLSKPFVVQADASEVAVGAVLIQVNEEGAFQLCVYTSQKLNDIERNWPIWEKESFAVRWALLTWQYLLEGGSISFEV